MSLGMYTHGGNDEGEGNGVEDGASESIIYFKVLYQFILRPKRHGM
jgi:hypothetical protein